MVDAKRSSICVQILPLLALMLVLAACVETSDPVSPGINPDDSVDQWVIEQGQPADVDFQSLWGAAADDIWALGSNGALLHFDGANWQLHDPWDRNIVDLQKVWGLASDAVWAVGDLGTVLHYDGHAWRFMANVNGEHLYGIWGTASDNLWVVSVDGNIYHFDGVRWELDYTHRSFMSDIVGTGSENIYACGDSATVLHYDGIDWMEMSIPPVDSIPLWSLCIDAEDRVWSCGDSGTVLRYSNGSWVHLNVPTGEALYGIDCAGGEVSTVGANGTILRFDGSVWGTMTSGVSGWLKGIRIFGEDDILVTGEAGSLLNWDGDSWASAFAGPSVDYEEVWVGIWGEAFAVTSSGGIYRRVAEQWAVDESAPSGTWFGVWGRDAQDVYVVGDGGSIIHFDGTSWTAMNSGTINTLRGVRGAGAQSVYAVGDGGTVLQLDGGTWLSIGPGTPISLNDIWVKSDGTLVAVGLNSIQSWDPLAEQWHQEYTGYEGDYRNITGSTDGSTYISTGSRIFVSYGSEWSLLPYSGDRVNEDLYMDATDVLWVTQEDGRIMCYENGVWRINARPCHISLTSIHGNAAGTLIAVGVEGIVLRYDP